MESSRRSSVIACTHTYIFALAAANVQELQLFLLELFVCWTETSNFVFASQAKNLAAFYKLN